jgi:parallel beta-helix repeat protein
MSFKKPPELHELQYDALGVSVVDNPYLPASQIPSKNKVLNTSKPYVTGAINELLQKIENIRNLVQTSLSQQQAVLGDFVSNPALISDLQKIDATVLEAIIKLSKMPQPESAYEIWLALGNTGTKEDFLNSLKGEKGADGKDGGGVLPAPLDINGVTGETVDVAVDDAGEIAAEIVPQSIAESYLTPALLEKINEAYKARVRPGGTPGQIYTKLSTDDYDADWGNAPVGGGSGGAKAATVIVGLEDSGISASDVTIFIPTGTTDCIPYLNQALSNVPDGGGKIILREGTYTTLTPWVIERNNVSIEGMGISTVINMEGVRNTYSGEDYAKTNNATIYVSGNKNTIKDLAVPAPSALATTLTVSSYGIYLSSASSNSTLVGNVLGNGDINSVGKGNIYGIYINGSNNNVITRNAFSNNSGSASKGIYIYESNNNNINGNTFSNGNSQSLPLQRDIRFYRSNNNNIIGNIFSSSGGSTSQGIFMQLSDNNNIIGNIFSNSGGSTSEGIWALGNNNNNIIGNIFSNSGGSTNHGIDADGLCNSTISGNVFNNSSTGGYNRGINICLGVDNQGNNTITGNTFSNSGGSINQGIYIYANNNNNITGNTFSNGKNSEKSYGVFIQSQSNIITGNTFSNTTAAQSTTSTFALYFIGPEHYSFNQIFNNDLTNVTRATSPGSAYTVDGSSPATLPGSMVSAEVFGTDNVAGFNMI